MSSIYERLLTKTADQLPHFYKKFSDQIINNEASLFIGAGVSRTLVILGGQIAFRMCRRT